MAPGDDDPLREQWAFTWEPVPDASIRRHVAIRPLPPDAEFRTSEHMRGVDMLVRDGNVFTGTPALIFRLLMGELVKVFEAGPFKAGQG